MSGGFNNPIIGGGGSLVYPSIHSPNFLPNTRGWSINKDGTAQFSGITILGGIELQYSPSPGFGNLISSSSPVAGTDAFGNAYLAGDTSYDTISPAQLFAVTDDGAELLFSFATSAAGPWSGLSSFSPGFLTFAGQQGPLVGWGASFWLSASAGGGGGTFWLSASGDATGATDAANMAAAFALGIKYLVLLPGTFHVSCGNATLISLGPGQYIVGSGDIATFINAHGSDDLFRWVHTGAISDGTTTGGGLIGGCTIDGSACTGPAIAVHAGDINALRFDFRSQHFTKSGGAWGMLCDNANNFTERLHLNVRFKDCGFAGGDGGHIGFTVSGATTSTASFARLRGRIEITQGSNQQDGLVLMAGAHIYDHQLEIIGNFQGNAVSATTAAVIRITGTVPALHPGAGSRSRISNGRLDIGVECSSATNAPTTLIQQTSSNSVDTCYGNVNWNTNLTSSALTGPGWKYDGQVQGDAALGTRRFYGDGGAQTITANGQAITSIQPSAKIRVTSAAAFNGLSLSPGEQDGQAIWLINTGASALTFAASPGSNLGAGVPAVLAAGSKIQLIWDATSALWY